MGGKVTKDDSIVQQGLEAALNETVNHFLGTYFLYSFFRKG